MEQFCLYLEGSDIDLTPQSPMMLTGGPEGTC